MKVSDLIKKLEAIKAKRGDIEVFHRNATDLNHDSASLNEVISLYMQPYGDENQEKEVLVVGSHDDNGSPMPFDSKEDDNEEEKDGHPEGFCPSCKRVTHGQCYCFPDESQCCG